MALSEIAIRNAKPNEKAYRIKDDYGLYIEIHPTGKKAWRMRYWIHQKEGNIKLGEYPLTNLKEARAKRDEARKLVEAGIVPLSSKNSSILEEQSQKIIFFVNCC